MKRHIPNLITLGNLLCGTIAVIFAIKGDFYAVAILVILGVLLDFLDGFVARILNVQQELGKQLDSLADMVTSGVVPGIVMLKMFEIAIDKDVVGYFGFDNYEPTGSNIPFLGLLLTLGAAYRLAKFNIESHPSDSFIGLPTPAMNLFIISLPLLADYTTQPFFLDIVSNLWFLVGVTLVFTYLMNSNLPMFSLKFNGFSIGKNKLGYGFLLVSLVLLIVFKTVAVPLIILLYIFVSLIVWVVNKPKAIV